MDRTAVRNKIYDQMEGVRAFGATSLYIFGSTARGDAGDKSDIDLFVEYDPATKFSLFDLAGIKVLLEEELGVEIDITTRDSLHPLLRDRIERSAIRVFRVMQRLLRPPLLAILAAIEGIEASMAGKTLEEYSGNWLLKHAVERGIEIISEAARRVPPALRDEHPEIPWKQIIAIGNILRHNYDRIIDRVIFDVIERDLPPLKAAISAIETRLDESG